ASARPFESASACACSQAVRTASAIACLAALVVACGGSLAPSAPPPPRSPADAGGPVDDLPDAGAPPDPAPDAGVTPPPPAGPTLAGCPMFPLDDPWNTDVSALPADAHSADYLAFMGAASLKLQPGFGGPYG